MMRVQACTGDLSGPPAVVPSKFVRIPCEASASARAHSTLSVFTPLSAIMPSVRLGTMTVTRSSGWFAARGAGPLRRCPRSARGSSARRRPATGAEASETGRHGGHGSGAVAGRVRPADESRGEDLEAGTAAARHVLICVCYSKHLIGPLVSRCSGRIARRTCTECRMYLRIRG